MKNYFGLWTQPSCCDGDEWCEGELVEDEALYAIIKSNIDCEVHAIYKLNADGFYCAAADMFEQGSTFKIYFKVNGNKSIEVLDIKRWFFG